MIQYNMKFYISQSNQKLCQANSMNTAKMHVNLQIFMKLLHFFALLFTNISSGNDAFFFLYAKRFLWNSDIKYTIHCMCSARILKISIFQASTRQKKNTPKLPVFFLSGRLSRCRVKWTANNHGK